MVVPNKKNKNMKDKLLNAGTCCTVGFHFVVCGLPLIVALFGGALSFSGIFGKEFMFILLALSGAMLALSAFAFVRCGCRQKWRAVMLCVVVLLYGAAVLGHFGAFSKAGESVGTEVVSCH
jgi:hypothetical protein